MVKACFEWIQTFFISKRISTQLSFTPLFQTQVFFWVNLSALVLFTPSFMGQIFWETWVPPLNKVILFVIYFQVLFVLAGVFWGTRHCSLKSFQFWVGVLAALEVCTVTASLFGFAYLAGSFHSSAFFWLPLMPVTMSYFTRPRYGILLAAASALVIIHFYYYFYILGHLNIDGLQSQVRGRVHFFDALSALGLAAFLAWIYESTKRRLQIKVAETQAEVEAQREKLFQSAKFHSLGEMAASLAHEVNNPLFMVQGKVHSMRNLVRKQDFDRSKYDQLVDEIESILMNLSKVAKGVSQFARSEDKENMTRISLKEVVEETLSFSRERFKEFAVELKTQIDFDKEIYCYPAFVSQILLNLLNNALDSVKKGAGRAQVVVRLYESYDGVILEVEDGGEGVKYSDVGKIFDPFYTTKPYGKGTGLGLSISRSLAMEHGGELYYEEVQKGGAKFVLQLPKSLKESAE